MKELKELKGVKSLTKKEQKSVVGGGIPCYGPHGEFLCGNGCCINGLCSTKCPD